MNEKTVEELCIYIEKMLENMIKENDILRKKTEENIEKYQKFLGKWKWKWKD